SLFCPPLDSALVAVIVRDYKDFNVCIDILNTLAKEANHVLESEHESELSENGSGYHKSYSSEPSSVYENGDGSVTSVDFLMDHLYFEDEFDFDGKDEEIMPDEEIERYNSCCSEGEFTTESLEGFLKECFPTLSKTKIKSLIRECNDAEIIFEKILKEAQQKETTYSYTSSSGSFVVRGDDDEDNSLISESRFKHRKKKRLRKQFQIDSYSPNFNTTPNSPTSKTTPLSPWNTQWPPPESERLSSWDSQWPPLPSSVPPEKKTHTNVSCDYKPNLSDQRDSIIRLSDIFPDRSVQSLEKALETANGVEERAIEILLGVNTVAEDRACSNNSSRSTFLSDGLGFKIETEQYKAIRPKKSNTPIRSPNTFTLTHASSSTRFTHDQNPSDDEASSDYEPKYCRQMANECMEKRNDAFRRAVKAWKSSRKSRYGDGGIASHYSAEGHKYDQEMKKWNSRAVKSMLKQRSRVDEYLLDLHGLTVNEATTVVKERLSRLHNSKGTTKSGDMFFRPLKIITGIGKHSPNRIAKLPEAIDRFLHENNWDFSKHKGYVLVKGRNSK
ncbi:2801_t:CDS:2, partial [Acaulospora morrowiae]